MSLCCVKIQGSDITDGKKKLGVVNIDYMPAYLLKKMEIVFITKNLAKIFLYTLTSILITSGFCHAESIDGYKLSCENLDVNKVDYIFTSMKDRSDIIKLAKAELKPFYRYLKRYDFEVSARNYAQLAFFSCQKFSALEFEECPKQYYDATLNSFSSKVLNEKLNSDVKSFIKKSLK